MTKKLKQHWLCFAAMIFTIVCATLLMINPLFKVKAETCPVTLSEPLKTQYVLGESITIPDGVLIYEGSDVTADKHTLVAPDGRAYSSAEVALSQSGKYVLTYYKELNGVTLSGSAYFIVKNTAFAVGENSTLSYGGNDKLDGTQGLNVVLANGDTFQCNIPLNLTGITNQDALLNLIPLPQKVGIADATELYVVLTDAYDPTNYLTIKTAHIDFPDVGAGDLRFGRSYQCAGASNQSLTGIRVTSSSSIQYNGEYYLVEVGGSAGYKSLCSLSAIGGYGDSKSTYKLSMNYGDKIIYGSDKFNSFGGTVITDLDNPLFFTDIWEGFTTGECYMSIYAGGYTSSSMEFMITDLLNVDLTATSVETTQEPTIEVDKKEDTYAVVGKPFPIFSATAMDVYSGLLQCNVKVLYNGTTSMPVVKGAFTPKYAGRYTIVYSVETKNGQTAETKVFVEAYATSPATVTLTPADNIVAGETYLFAGYQAFNTSGDYTMSMRAVLKSDTSVAYDLVQTEDGYEFTPLYAGEYDLIYTVNDYLGESVHHRDITVQKGSIVLKNAPKLPAYFIGGATYNFGNVSCYDLSSGVPVEKSVDAYYQFDGGEAVKVTGTSLKITATSSAKILFRNGNTTIAEYDVPVISVGYNTTSMEIYKYFHSADGSVTFNNSDKSFNYSAYTLSGEGANMQFIKEISIATFEFSFSVPTCNFSTLQLTLANEEQTLAVAIKAISNTQSRVTVNGKAEFLVTSAFKDGSNVTVRYFNTTKMIALTFGGEYYTYNVPESAFEGFTSNTASFSLSVSDYSGANTSKMRVFKLNNQAISSQKVDDYTAPEIYHSISAGIKPIGSKVLLTGIGAEDVLYVDSSCTFSVYSPDGNIVTADDGTLLRNIAPDKDYVFTLSSYGSYNVNISAEDEFGNSTKKVVSVTVNDNIAPTITMNSNTVTQAVGSALSLRSYSVSDNLDETTDLRVRVMVIAPNGVSHAYTEGMLLTQKGEYLVMVYAIDSYQNITQAHYTVVVK